MEKLSNEQRLAISLRYNLHPDYEEALTLIEAGKVIGCSGASVSKLEEEALSALRTKHGMDLSIFAEQ